MKRLKVLLLFRILLLAPLVAAMPADDEGDDFKLVKQQGAIALYERWVTQPNQEQVREIKAVFRVQSSIPTMVNVFKDQREGKTWNTNAKSYSVLNGPDQNVWITYIKYSVPWPMDDQDCCLSYQLLNPAPGGTMAEILFESTTHSSFPESQNTNRITGTKGKWIMQQEAGGKMLVTYLVRTDRNKKIPRWVSDPVVHSNLFKTISNLKMLLEKK